MLGGVVRQAPEPFCDGGTAAHVLLLLKRCRYPCRCYSSGTATRIGLMAACSFSALIHAEFRGVKLGIFRFCDCSTSQARPRNE